MVTAGRQRAGYLGHHDNDDLACGAVTADLVAIAVHAAEPDRLARFWAHALRCNRKSSDGADVVVEPTDATRFHVLFRPVAVPKIGQNRIHFDLTTTSPDDQANTVAELLTAGARHVDIGQDPGESHVVLADPDGNELCIIGPDNRFLASCPRLGAVNCDGTRALGCFWSEALGWPLVWDQDDETAIQAPDGTGPKITWSGPPLMPKLGADRYHFHVAPGPEATVASTLDHLLALGATRLDVGQACPGAIVLADVDGNKFCLVQPLGSTQGGPPR